MDSTKNAFITWPELIQGTLRKRYKRFLADVRLTDETVVTAHCPNSGSMRGCSQPGRPVYISRQDGPRRKLPYTWELIDMGSSLVGVNTLIPNRLVKQAICSGHITELQGYSSITPEVRVSDRTRLDLLLETTDGSKCYLEIKNCTLVEKGTASFPDAVTERGRRHLLQLQGLKKQGHRAVIFYVIQRMDADRFAPAAAIDPAYATELNRAVENGVEALVYDTRIDLQSISLGRRIPWP
ncbi:MAG: DNA/RNA nuclease SfsA [Desulfohalobiaceae bacterium]|nr:DNA/RNA nuclease SfsA [Desulfohalobiaceae bacterium]